MLRWWVLRRVEGWRKFPLVDRDACYFWGGAGTGGGNVRQWRTFKGFSARDVGELERWVGEEQVIRDGDGDIIHNRTVAGREDGVVGNAMKWKKDWNRRRTVSWTMPDGTWRGALDAESVERYRKEMANHWARRCRVWLYKRLSIESRKLGTGVSFIGEV